MLYAVLYLGCVRQNTIDLLQWVQVRAVYEAVLKVKLERS